MIGFIGFGYDYCNNIEKKKINVFYASTWYHAYSPLKRIIANVRLKCRRRKKTESEREREPEKKKKCSKWWPDRWTIFRQHSIGNKNNKKQRIGLNNNNTTSLIRSRNVNVIKNILNSSNHKQCLTSKEKRTKITDQWKKSLLLW